MNRLEGKLCIVTGAARGMGAVTARRFIEEGATVIVADVLDELGQNTAQSLGKNAHYHHLDVADEQGWQALLAFADALGPVSVLVNNAGILHAASIADTSAEDFMRVMQVNQLGPFLGIRGVSSRMRENGAGSIINTSSIDGFQAKNGLAAYASSKWALRGLTKTAAIELGPFGIRVNSVHPGGIFTAMHGADAKTAPDEQDNAFYKQHALPRVGLPEEVANMSLFLASDESSYSTGAEFLVDGGWNAGLRIDLLPGA